MTGENDFARRLRDEQLRRLMQPVPPPEEDPEARTLQAWQQRQREHPGTLLEDVFEPDDIVTSHEFLEVMQNSRYAGAHHLMDQEIAEPRGIHFRRRVPSTWSMWGYPIGIQGTYRAFPHPPRPEDAPRSVFLCADYTLRTAQMLDDARAIDSTDLTLPGSYGPVPIQVGTVAIQMHTETYSDYELGGGQYDSGGGLVEKQREVLGLYFSPTSLDDALLEIALRNT